MLLAFLTSYADDQKVTIEADNVSSTEQNTYHATGNVKIFQGERTMLADEVYYFKDINYLEATGNVRLNDETETIECSRAEYNTQYQTGVFYDANAFMEPYSWFKAKEAKKTGVNSFSLKHASYTTCSGDKPAWSLTTSSADLDVGGYLSAYNVAGWAKKVPVFYTPYIIYPVKTERESGFLMPRLGVSSNDGAFIQPQYFWNIDVDKDTTFAVLLSEKSKPLFADEFRFTPTTDTTIYNYLEFTGENREVPKEEVNGDNIDITAGRYFIFNKSKIKLNDDLSMKIDVETVSDYSYLDDYEDYSLLTDYNNDDENFINNFELAYASYWSNVTLKYNDTFNYTVTDAFVKEHTYSLPSVTAEQDISDYPIGVRYYLSYDRIRHTKYNFTYDTAKEYAKDLTYSRNHATIELYKPFDMYIGTLTPAVKMYYTKWYGIDSNYNMTLPTKDHLSSFAGIDSDSDSIERQAYTLSYSFAFKEIYRNYDNFKHSIYNTITYRQTPTIDQTNLFDYAYEDTLDAENIYEYTLQNYFKAANWQFRLENTQGYDMNKDSEKLAPFITKIDYIYTKLLTMHTENRYDYDEKNTTYMTFKTKLNMKPVSFSVSYAYDKDTSEDQNTTISGNITYSTEKYDLAYKRTSSGWNSNLSLKTESSVDDAVSLIYKSECWQLGVTYSRKTEIDNVAYSNAKTSEHVFMLTLGLRGLGKYSSSIYTDKTDEEGDVNE